MIFTATIAAKAITSGKMPTVANRFKRVSRRIKNPGFDCHIKMLS